MERVSYDLTDEVTDIEFFFKNKRLTVIDAWASWCVPCKTFSDKYEIIANEWKKEVDKGEIIFLKDNIDDQFSLHRENLHVVPTYFIYVYGELKRKGNDIESLRNDINELFLESQDLVNN